MRERSLGQRFGSTPSSLRALRQEVPREQRNVFRALAQMRQAQANDVQAVVQVLAEQALAHALLEILVRRRDDAHVRLDRLVAADAVERRRPPARAAGASAVGRHVADLVEEQRAAFGLLEAAAPLRCAPVNAPRSWPNSSHSSRSFGIAAVLIAMNGLRRARAVLVQRARDQLLAGARFAGDQHRRRSTAKGGRSRGTPPASPAPGRGSPASRPAARVALGFAPALVERAADELHRLVDVERLRQVLERAALERGDRAVEVGIRGHHDDRHAADGAASAACSSSRPDCPACGCRTRAPAARSPASALSASCADENVCAQCLRARAPSRAPSGSSGRRRRSRQVSWLRTSASALVSCCSAAAGSVNTVRPGGLSNSMTPWCCCDEGLRERKSQAGAAFPPDTSG